MIDNALRAFNGISIFSVEMINPYVRHRQLLLGGSVGDQTAAPTEESPAPTKIIPESSNFDESIIPDEEKDDVEVVIDNDTIQQIERK